MRDLEEEKGDLPQDVEEAGEDLKMSEDRVDPSPSTLPKKRGRKPKVITDASAFGQSPKTQQPKGVEPSTSTIIEVPEEVITTVTYVS